MIEEKVLVELRFDSDARDSLDISVSRLKESDVDVEVEDTARDPNILAALTIAAAAAKLVIELINLAKALRAKGEKKSILVVKLDENNKEKSIQLLQASEADIKQFLLNE